MGVFVKVGWLVGTSYELRVALQVGWMSLYDGVTMVL